MNWQENLNCIEKTFVFNNFKMAIKFINEVAALAEKENHHPTIINTFNKVAITLSTHDSGNIVTQKDYDLAKLIDKIIL